MSSSRPRFSIDPRAPRFIASVGATAAILCSASTALAVNRNWIGTDHWGDWNLATNWSPLGAPGAADFVSVGNTAQAENSWAVLDANATIAGLAVTDGMAVFTDTAQLVVTGATTVSGYNSDGVFAYPSRVEVGQSPFATDFWTSDLTLSDGAWLSLNDGGTAYVDDYFLIGTDCALNGEGTLRLGGDQAIAMKVNGGIGAGLAGLTILQQGTGLIDLDGDVGGDQTLTVALANLSQDLYSHLTIDGTALADQFDDDILIGGSNVLTMSLDEGWAMGPGTELRFLEWAGGSPDPAKLAGSHLDMYGTINASGSSVHALITAPLSLHPGCTVTIGEDDLLDISGATTIEGGNLLVADGGILNLLAATTVHGGAFSTASEDANVSSVRLAGPTTWDGDVTVQGILRQIGDATVFGPTTISGDRFDFDGDGTTAWTIGNGLVLNVDHIDNTIEIDSFDGTMDLPANFLAKLTVQLTAPGAHWLMSGTLDVAGVGALTSTRLAGSSMWLTGDMNVTGRVASAAPIVVRDSGDVTFTSPTAALRFNAQGFVHPNAGFFGEGMVETASGGDLTLASGASLSLVGLKNAGIARIGEPIGVAFVDRFENTSTGALFVDIGGPQQGAEHDALLVTGEGTTLAGKLVVSIASTGNGYFEPHPGDSFTIIESDGPVAGAFQNSPVSFVPGMVYLWTVATQPHSVVLTLAKSVPCPGDLDGDGQVGPSDLAMMLGAWGPCKACDADLNASGAVDAADLAMLLGAWGACQY